MMCSAIDDSLVEANRAARAAVTARLPVQKQTQVLSSVPAPLPTLQTYHELACVQVLTLTHMGVSAAKGHDRTCSLGSQVKVEVHWVWRVALPHIHQVPIMWHLQAA